MRDALLQDLSQLPYQVHTTIDGRLDLPEQCNFTRSVHVEDDCWQVWEDEIKAVDAVWLLAPETGGYLVKMTALAVLHGKKILGCGLISIKTCSSKLATYQLMQQSQIATIPTCKFMDWQQITNKTWVVKPDDGAGCEETMVFDEAKALTRWMQRHDKFDSHVIQPYMLGIAASISCIMHQGRALVLSCNQQMISKNNNTLQYDGCIVNGLPQYRSAFDVLANKIAHLLTDLTGYVGIDVIIGRVDAEITVVEINPRLTTSYVALSEATNTNPAELIIKTLTQAHYTWPSIEQNVVRLILSQEEQHA
ncbi:MAG: ATP-grasp domain-containing protein [Methylophilaceae bacterium]